MVCKGYQFSVFFCRLLIFSKTTFFEKFFQEYHQCHSMDPDQAGHFAGPDLRPICLQRILADNTRRQQVKI